MLHLLWSGFEKGWIRGSNAAVPACALPWIGGQQWRDGGFTVRDGLDAVLFTSSRIQNRGCRLVLVLLALFAFRLGK